MPGRSWRISGGWSKNSRSRIRLLETRLSEYARAGIEAIGGSEGDEAETPVAEEPLTEEPLTEEPLTEEPLTEEPLTEEPLTEEPLTEEPLVEEPAVDDAPGMAIEPVDTQPPAEESAEEELQPWYLNKGLQQWLSPDPASPARQLESPAAANTLPGFYWHEWRHTPEPFETVKLFGKILAKNALTNFIDEERLTCALILDDINEDRYEAAEQGARILRLAAGDLGARELEARAGDGRILPHAG